MAQNQQTEPIKRTEFEELPQLSVAEFEFVRLIVHEGKTASEAYRKSHDTAGMTDSAIWSKASRLRGTARIQEHESALLDWGMTKGILGHEEAGRKMSALAARAEKAGNYGAAVNAMDKVVKLSGHYVEQVRDISTESTVEDLLMGIEQLLGKEARDKAALELGVLESGNIH